MQPKPRVTSLIVGGICLWLAGCGGGTPAKKPAVVIQPNAAPQANAAAPIGNQPPLQTPGPVNPNNQSAAPVVSEEELPPPGPDDFEIEPVETVTEVAGEFREPPPEPVEVVALSPGTNSSTFEIVDENASDNTSVRATGTSNSIAGPGNSTTATKESGVESEEGSWTLPEGAKAVEGFGIDAETGLPLRITLEKDPVQMVLIPPGVFIEGIDGRDPIAAPQHSVLLENPYYIDIVEVTVARHDAFREFFRKTEGRKMDPAANRDGNPEAAAVGIKFLDAKFYARWTGKELPTEAQWERAARGDHGYEFPWGGGRPIFHQPRQPGQLDPVATFPGDRSPFGVYDMGGSAREWCLDIFASDTFQKQAGQGGSPVRNPTGPKTFQGAKLQVVKGGKSDWAVWHRTGVSQSEVPRDVGFRCVLNITADTGETDKRSSAKGANKPAGTKTDKKKKSVGL